MTSAKSSTRSTTRRRGITCIDIARMADVAPATVSRVINNPQLVSSSKRDRVLAAIKATGYRPSVAASSLPRRKHDVIGLVSEIPEDINSYSSDLTSGVSLALSELGQRMSMGTIHYRDRAETLEHLPLLRLVAVDGLILDTHSILGDVDSVVTRLRVPHVFVNAPKPRKYNTVMPDDVQVARRATQYLADRGHRRITYMPGAQRQLHSSQPLRMAGYHDTMSGLGLPLGPMWNVPAQADGYQIDDYVDRMKVFRAESITGIVAYNARAAALLLRACIILGVHVPQDISIISCDYEAMLTFAAVPITGFYLNRTEMGTVAVTMLMNRIENDWADQPSIMQPEKLIECNSVRILHDS